jgi:hypothetical protein
VVRIRLILHQKRNDLDIPFRVLVPERGPCAPFLFSLGLHAAVLWLATSYVTFVAKAPKEVFDLQTARVLNLSVDPLEDLRAIRGPAPTEPKRTGASHAVHRSNSMRHAGRAAGSFAPARSGIPGRESQGEPSLSGPSALAAVAKRELRAFVMPPINPKHAVPQTLVQLDLPPMIDLHQDLRVPQLVILASTPRHLPKPFVAPPERKRTVEVPSQVALEMRSPILDAQPRYAISPDVLPRLAPRLPAPVGAVAPVKTFRPPPVQTKPAASTVTGNSTSDPPPIISLVDRPIPIASSIVLPPLNQVSRTDSSSGASGGQAVNSGRAFGGNFESRDSAPASRSQNGGSSANGALQKPGGEVARHGDRSPLAGVNDKTPVGGTRTQPGTGSSIGDRPATGSGGLGAGTTPLQATSGIGPPSRSAVTGSEQSGLSGMGATGTSQSGRMVRPIDGHYDIDIVQSSGAIPGTSGLLKGRPVYSVYLPVEAGKEWILQFCLPEQTSKPAVSSIVRIDAIAPLTAPYAFSIVRPAIRFRAGAHYAFIHGFVTVSGRFEGLIQAGEQAIENFDSVVGDLQQWEFRPAAKDGQPTAVEILLCIPNSE